MRCVSLLVPAILGAAAQAGPVFRTVARSDQQAPGQPAGVTLGTLSDPRINGGGQALFLADLSGPGVTTLNDTSIWSDRTGSLSLLYRKGSPNGQGPSTVWSALVQPAFNTAGQAAFIGAIIDTAQPGQPINAGLFAEDASFVLQKIAREGEPAQPSGSWLRLLRTDLGPSGAARFAADVADGALIKDGLWDCSPGQTPALIAERRDPAPGTAGLAFDLGFEPLTSNNAGAVVFRANAAPLTSQPPVTPGLWIAQPLALLADAGQPAPGTASSFRDFGSRPAIDAQGRAVFWGRLASSTGPGDDDGLWAGTPGALQLVVREGVQAAGCPVGIVYRSISAHPAVSPTGAIVFAAGLGNADPLANSGIWVVNPGAGPALLAREGSQAPRLPSGVVFAGFDEPVINAAGQIAVMARLAGSGVDASNNQALFLTDRAGGLYPLLRTGDLFDVGSGSPRLIDEIIFTSDPDQSGRAQFADTASGGAIICKLVFRDPTLPPATAYTSAIVTGSLRCLSDFDGNGSLGVNDFIGFLNAFAARDLRACDFSGNGSLEVLDFMAFLNAAAACP